MLFHIASVAISQMAEMPGPVHKCCRWLVLSNLLHDSFAARFNSQHHIACVLYVSDSQGIVSTQFVSLISSGYNRWLKIIVSCVK